MTATAIYITFNPGLTLCVYSQVYAVYDINTQNITSKCTCSVSQQRKVNTICFSKFLSIIWTSAFVLMIIPCSSFKPPKWHKSNMSNFPLHQFSTDNPV